MLNRNETEETIGFFVTFLSLVKFQLGGSLPPLPLPMPMLKVRKTKKCVCNFSVRFMAFYNEILTVQKIVLSSSRGQGNFWGFEAKVNDFKMCPRGLLLWLLICGRPCARMAWLGGGGAEIKFGGHKKFISVNLRGAREIHSSVDHTEKVKTKNKKGLKFKNFHKF